jgi:hypothetical protein
LVEELGLRTECIEPAMGELEAFSRRVDELKACIDESNTCTDGDREAAGSRGERELW